MIAKTSVARDGLLPRVVAVAVGVFVVVAMAGVGWWLLREPGRGGSDKVVAQADTNRNAAVVDDARSQSAPRSKPRQAPTMSSNDPDDLAAYFQPGDPEPTGAQVITALQQAGVRTGLGAFNPPGTSPPLIGLAVPEGYDLPQGYVRHHQVTDEGVAIEPILMFSPDFDVRDARGRPIAMPPDRVVPPELAPPGMPLRQIRIPQR